MKEHAEKSAGKFLLSMMMMMMTLWRGMKNENENGKKKAIRRSKASKIHFLGISKGT